MVYVLLYAYYYTELIPGVASEVPTGCSGPLSTIDPILDRVHAHERSTANCRSSR